MYACVIAILVLALIFGRRARRNVKNERVTKMPKGFSPLDVQRIFIGKTFPRRLTCALIAHWAQMGYIKVEYVSPLSVRIHRRKDMPSHYSDKAVFFDRGTYVRERELFKTVIDKTRGGKPIKLFLPLVTKAEVRRISEMFAVREDEGVYSATHYTLKLVTFALSILPLLLSAIALSVLTGMYFVLLFFFTALIGLIVLMFVRDMPILFKAAWCGMWLGVSIGMSLTTWITSDVNDFLGIIYVAVTILFAGPIVLIRFVDYREKNNLAEYSDLRNYRKFLLKSGKDELGEDYYAALPYLYTYNIKWLVGRRFKHLPPPKWYEGDTERKGWLL